jgi:hypothetical protein
MAESANATSTPLNLFLAHSPFQYFVACHMVNNMPEFRTRSNYLVVDPVWSGVAVDEPGWQEVIICEPPVGGSVVGAGRRMRSVVRRVLALFDPPRSARLFLANVQWPMNNVLRATLVNREFPTPIEVCNYPEGIGSLRLVYPDWRQHFRDLMKSALGLISGVRYQPLKEDLMGLETSARIYSLLPQLLPAGLQSKAVTIPPFPMPPGEVDRHTCMFLGQNDRLLPERLRRPLAVASAAYCRSLPYKRFVFKSHHYGESELQREAFIGSGFERLTDTRPVEQILMVDTVACVVSFNSSALVHLKMMFGDRIRCIACFPEQFGQMARQQARHTKGIHELFEKTGVEIFEEQISGVRG